MSLSCFPITLCLSISNVADDLQDALLVARIESCRRKVAQNARFVRWMLQLWAAGQLVVFVSAQMKNGLGSALGGVAVVAGIVGGSVGWFRRYRLRTALERAEQTRVALRGGLSNDL